MKEWQFNILFFVGVGGAIFLLISPELGLDVASNPTALAGVGSILTYILTQRKSLTKKPENKTKRRTSLSDNHDEDEQGEEDVAPRSIRRVPSEYGDPRQTGEDDER